MVCRICYFSWFLQIAKTNVFWRHDDFTLSFSVGAAKSMPYSGRLAEELIIWWWFLHCKNCDFHKHFDFKIGVSVDSAKSMPYSGLCAEEFVIFGGFSIAKTGFLEILMILQQVLVWVLQRAWHILVYGLKNWLCCCGSCIAKTEVFFCFQNMMILPSVLVWVLQRALHIPCKNYVIWARRSWIIQLHIRNLRFCSKTRKVAIYIALGMYFPVRTVFVYANGTVFCVSYDSTIVLMGILEMHKHFKSKRLYVYGMFIVFSVCFVTF